MKISIVVPVLDEEDNIAPLCRRLTAALSPVTDEFEILFVDDGSRDGSLRVLRQAHARDPRVRALSLSRCFGHQAALTAGIDHARGEAVITMDGDLEHPPETIPEMVARWKEGCEIVHAIRREAPGESAFKRGSARAFYWIFQKMSGVALPPRGADFRLLDQKVVRELRRLRERTRLMRGLSSWVGYRTTTVCYDSDPRRHGRSKYDLVRMVRLAADGILSFSLIPLYMGVWTGFLLGMSTVGYVAFALYSRFISGQVLPGWTSVAVLIGGVGSVQLIVTGLIGLYVGKIYEEAKQRPLYLIGDSIGMDP